MVPGLTEREFQALDAIRRDWLNSELTWRRTPIALSEFAGDPPVPPKREFWSHLGRILLSIPRAIAERGRRATTTESFG